MGDEKNSVSLLDNDVKMKFRTLFLNGESVANILDILNIPKGTFDNYYYTNRYAIRDWVKEIKKERFLMKTEQLSNDILDMKHYKDSKILGIMQKESEFVRETLLKDEGYTKRTETIGLNVNKNEPLDDDQKKKLDMIINKSGVMSE